RIGKNHDHRVDVFALPISTTSGDGSERGQQTSADAHRRRSYTQSSGTSMGFVAPPVTDVTEVAGRNRLTVQSTRSLTMPENPAMRGLVFVWCALVLACTRPN